jgi:hypothetical protein
MTTPWPRQHVAPEKAVTCPSTPRQASQLLPLAFNLSEPRNFIVAKSKSSYSCLDMSPSFKPIIRKCASYDQMRDIAVHDWQKRSAKERSDAAWDMVKEAWALKNRNPDELRLQRTITVIHKA